MTVDVSSGEKPHVSTAGDIWNGIRSGVPVAIAASPFGLLYGAVAVENGLSVWEATLMSAAIFGGASQMVGIELFGAHIAPWLVVLSIFAVNFRHVLYSAAMGRRIVHWSPLQQIAGFFFLTDPLFGDAERRAEEGQRITFVWFMAAGLSIYLPWVAGSFFGALFGQMVPDTKALGIDYLLPIYFLGMVMGFRSRPYWLPVVAASAVASVVAYRTIGSPWHVSLGAVVGVALAAMLPVRGPEKP